METGTKLTDYDFDCDFITGEGCIGEIQEEISMARCSSAFEKLMKALRHKEISPQSNYRLIFRLLLPWITSLNKLEFIYDHKRFLIEPEDLQFIIERNLDQEKTAALVKAI